MGSVRGHDVWGYGVSGTNGALAFWQISGTMCEKKPGIRGQGGEEQHALIFGTNIASDAGSEQAGDADRYDASSHGVVHAARLN